MECGQLPRELTVRQIGAAFSSAFDKGKPVVKRGRKAMGLDSEIARLPKRFFISSLESVAMLLRTRSSNSRDSKLPSKSSALLNWFSGLHPTRKRSPRNGQSANQFHFQALENRLVMSASVGDFDLHSLDPIESTAVTETSSEGETLPLASIPVLSSNSSATAKLYLDFDGHFESQWGAYSNITTPAFSLDSDFTTFSSAEIDAMTEIWQRVAEDYAPFDIDVTTVNPGDFSNGLGMRVSIGGNGSWFGNAGGVAYVNTWTNSIVNTVYVFTDKLAKNAKYIGEASSHEAGHGFGLDHQSKYVDGVKSAEYHPGSGDWAPIMGVSYYKTRTTWSDGTTTSATTYQDDMAVIARSANGFGYRTDDHGDLNSATMLAFVGNNATASGLIEKMSDEDAFSFTTTGGQIDVSVNVAEVGANLDAVLELRTLSGSLIATVDPSGEYGASLSMNVAAGDYVLVVKSTGEYGSVGQYTVDVTRSMSGVSIAGDNSVREGDVFTLNLLENDPGSTVIDGWTIDWGDGTVETITGNPGTASHVYLNGPGNYAIQATAAHATGTFESNILLLNVYNPIPVLTISGAGSTTEGSSYVLALAATDTGPDTISSWTINWGDGTVETVTGNPNSVSHIYADGTSQFTIQATATNAAGTFTANTKAITVNNVDAVLSVNGSGVVTEGDVYTLSLSSNDPGADTISSWTINWGDGTIETFSGDPSQVVHVYATSGNYTITATAADEDGTYQSNASGVSVTTNLTLDAPSHLTGQTDGSEVQITWQDNSNGESGFVIERAKKPKGKGSPSWSEIGAVGAGSTSYSDNPGGGEWIYRVRAIADVNGDGLADVFSSYSNEVNVSIAKSGGGGGSKGSKGGGPNRGLRAGNDLYIASIDWGLWMTSAQTPNSSAHIAANPRSVHESIFANYDGSLM